MGLGGLGVSGCLTGQSCDMGKDGFSVRTRFIRCFEGVPNYCRMVQGVCLNSVLSYCLSRCRPRSGVVSSMRLLLSAGFVIDLLSLGAPRSAAAYQRLLGVTSDFKCSLHILGRAVGRAASLLLGGTRCFSGSFLPGLVGPRSVCGTYRHHGLGEGSLRQVTSGLRGVLISRCDVLRVPCAIGCRGLTGDDARCTRFGGVEGASFTTLRSVVTLCCIQRGHNGGGVGRFRSMGY